MLQQFFIQLSVEPQSISFEQSISLIDALYHFTPTAFKNGDLILHKNPGLGFEFDEAAVKKYAGKSAWSKIGK